MFCRRCSRDTLLTPCAMLHVFKKFVANTMYSAVHVLKRCAAKNICSAVHSLNICVVNNICSAVDRPEVSLSTSRSNIYSSYQNTFTTAMHSPPPSPLPSVLLVFCSDSLTAYPYDKKTKPDFSILQSYTKQLNSCSKHPHS